MKKSILVLDSLTKLRLEVNVKDKLLPSTSRDERHDNLIRNGRVFTALNRRQRQYECLD